MARPLLIHPFDRPPDGSPSELAAVLGGKGAGLVRMTALGLPVPPGFTITTDACHRTLESGWPSDLDSELRAALDALGAALDRRLGDPAAPLLVSVRSGAPVSMPGMMDTVLDVGMTTEVAVALGDACGDPDFGWDTYRRFIDSYAAVVLEAPDEVLADARAAVDGQGRPTRESVIAFRDRLAATGLMIPDDPFVQVRTAVAAVFGSWRSDRAVVYRRLEGIDERIGTAATVQAMVFGNLDDDSGTGVAFSRDPATGEDVLTGDFLRRAQGEDVVAGTHRTEPIAAMAELWPTVAAELRELAHVLERDLADMVDIEFTVERGRLWLLQTRRGKRSPRAALRVAVDMAEDPGFPVDRAEAVARVTDVLDAPPVESLGDVGADATVIATGIAASPGLAVGVICTDVDAAIARAAAGEDVILVRPETSPADVHGMADARGLVTTLGGMVSHAAVIARSWGLPAVVGAAELTVEAEAVVGPAGRFETGTVVTVDGEHGRFLLGAHAGEGTAAPELAVLRGWRDEAGAPPAEATDGAPFDTETARRLLALKGLATAVTLAGSARVTDDVVAATLTELATDGEAEEMAGERWRLTPAGTEIAAAAFTAEADRVAADLEPLMARFHTVNGVFKEVVTAWQTRVVDGEQTINDHADADYDAAVISRLATDVHPEINAVLDDAAAHLPRIGGYRVRLQLALDAIRAGDPQRVAHPLRDSYHTVWFELHEELIRLTGRNRADEAKAGRG